MAENGEEHVDPAPRGIRVRTIVTAVIVLVLGTVGARLWLIPGSFDDARLRLPLARLEVSPELREAVSLSAPAGSLAQHDVLLITLDTTRADRLGLYGNTAIATPTLDALAREGVVFTNAVATTSSTLPTHASILTGLYPHRHGARANSRYRLEDDAVTLAEVLGQAGYSTAAFVSALVLDQRFGLDQGFTLFDAKLGGASVVGGYAERRGDATVDGARRWFEMPRSKPAFTWLHFFDPHGAYTPPEPYGQQSANPYDGEIAFVDAQIARVIEWVRANDRRETLVVIVADHGQALGEHGEWSHGFLAQEATLQIPLLMWATDGLPGGVFVPTRVSQVDLMPTILSLVGVDVPDGLDGVTLTAPPAVDRPVLAEAVYGHAFHGWAPLAVLYEGRFKLVDGPRPELYDLVTDPLETNDLAPDEPDRVRAMQTRLHALRGDEADNLAATTVSLSEEDAAQLQALGYVTGSERATPLRSDGSDPKTMVPMMMDLLDVLGAYELGRNTNSLGRLTLRMQGLPVIADHDALIEAMEAFADAHPDFAPAYHRLATEYRSAGRFDEADTAERRAEELAG